MLENKGYVHPEVLVDADWVQAHLHDPKVRLIEVDVDTTAYDQGHIPGAVAYNWQKELQDQVVRAPLSKERLEELLGSAGVDNDTTVVLYGDITTGLPPGHSGSSSTMGTRMRVSWMAAA